MERIHEDIARITSDSVDQGSIDSQHGKDPQTYQGLPLAMLILRGSIDGQLGKDLQYHREDPCQSPKDQQPTESNML